mmetsp:Transcript_82491/g.129888  ORF Transcript_82491/g.129888 Transcript_82491/m.129888 type:complete len:84 (+) Transcript_82491:921-1172(+)
MMLLIFTPDAGAPNERVRELRGFPELLVVEPIFDVVAVEPFDDDRFVADVVDVLLLLGSPEAFGPSSEGMESDSSLRMFFSSF